MDEESLKSTAHHKRLTASPIFFEAEENDLGSLDDCP
jgi:hypothetical protein